MSKPTPPERPSVMARTMRIVLPYPPSANLLWRQFRGVTVVSPEARRYKQGVKLRGLTAGFRPFAGPVCVSLGVYRPRKSGDLDNRIKALLDSLKGVAFEDDEQVVEIHAMRFEDKADPRVEVTVTEVLA